MPSQDLSLEKMTLTLREEIFVNASLESTFAALLDQMGPNHELQEGKPMPMKLEAWPGGRWFRDLGQDNGHFWGQVQAIKRPTLLEVCGPLLMSYPTMSNIQYRLIEKDGGTLIKFHHLAFGQIEDGHKDGYPKAWALTHGKVKRQAESASI